MKKVYVKSRKPGGSYVSIMVISTQGKDEKIKMAIRKFIKNLRKVTNGQVEFEYEIILKERHNWEAE